MSTFTTHELQAAAAALVAGEFRPRATATGSGTGTADADVLNGLALVRVRAASAGAGASTVALALAEASDAAGLHTRVIEAAAPQWSGLSGATLTEVGVAQGWRRGRRGATTFIDRLDEPVATPGEVPAPRSGDEATQLAILDTGWSMRELSASPSWLSSVQPQLDVVVARAHRHALSQIETALELLGDRLDHAGVVVVVVGPSRWNNSDFASAGRRLRAAHEAGAVEFAPLLPTKVLPGLGPDPLPKQLSSLAQRLLGHLTTLTAPHLAADTTEIGD